LVGVQLISAGLACVALQLQGLAQRRAAPWDIFFSGWVEKTLGAKPNTQAHLRPLPVSH